MTTAAYGCCLTVAATIFQEGCFCVYINNAYLVFTLLYSPTSACFITTNNNFLATLQMER